MRREKSIKRVEYSSVRKRIRSGDLLSFKPRCSILRPWSYWTWLIALTNKGHHCHSAMAAWWGENLMCVQMTASPDRIVLLSDYVKKWPGTITVSRPLVPRSFRRKEAVDRMVRITERPYGWVRLFVLGFAHTFTGNLLYPNAADDDQKSKWPPVCSESYSRSMRLSGFDPVLDRPDSRTEPNHLFESPRMRPLFTLM
jgi:hypothetical protein